MEQINYQKSVFHFYIKETLNEFEHKLRTFHKKGVVSFVEDFAVTLYDQKKDYKIKFEKDYTANGDVWQVTFGKSKYRYLVRKGESGCVCVVFEGPILGLWQQYLLPHISYKKRTLVGKYDGMEDFLPINKFMEVRLAKNNGVASEQDEIAGHRVNKFVQNEVESLPKYMGKAGNKWEEKVPYEVAQQRKRNERKGTAGKAWKEGRRRRG